MNARRYQSGCDSHPPSHGVPFGSTIGTIQPTIRLIGNAVLAPPVRARLNAITVMQNIPNIQNGNINRRTRSFNTVGYGRRFIEAESSEPATKNIVGIDATR